MFCGKEIFLWRGGGLNWFTMGACLQKPCDDIVAFTAWLMNDGNCAFQRNNNRLYSGKWSIVQVYIGSIYTTAFTEYWTCCRIRIWILYRLTASEPEIHKSHNAHSCTLHKRLYMLCHDSILLCTCFTLVLMFVISIYITK